MWFTHCKSTFNHYSGPPKTKKRDSHITSQLSTITADPIQQSMWFTHYKSPVNHYSGPHTTKHVIHTLQVTCQPLQRTPYNKACDSHITSHLSIITADPIQQSMWFTHYKSPVNHYSRPQTKKHVIHTLQVTCQPLQQTPNKEACDSHITSHLSTITADPKQRSMWFTHYKSPVNHYSRPQTKKHVIHTLQFTCQALQQTPDKEACHSHKSSQQTPNKEAWFTHYKSTVNHHSRPQTEKHHS